MTPTFVVIPVKNQWELTRNLLACLNREPCVDDVLILNDGSTDGTPNRIRQLQRTSAWWKDRIHQTDRTGSCIYEAWSRGFARARALASGGEFNALFLNNDVVLPHGTVGLLAAVLRSHPEAWVTYPDYDDAHSSMLDYYSSRPADALYNVRETRGVLGDGGMFGPAFMLKGEAIPWDPLVTDASYRWWYGDNHLAECIEEEGGKQLRVVGLPIRHVNEGTAQHYPELYDVKLADRERWVSRHSRGLRAIDRRA